MLPVNDFALSNSSRSQCNTKGNKVSIAMHNFPSSRVVFHSMPRFVKCKKDMPIIGKETTQKSLGVLVLRMKANISNLSKASSFATACFSQL